jgi:hypothetical protein
MSAVPPAQRKRQVQSSIADCVTSVMDVQRAEIFCKIMTSEKLTMNNAIIFIR